MNEYKNISFSPPDITDAEIEEVNKVLKSGWVTTGPETKMLEKNIADYIGVGRAVCLNSATAALELILRILGIGEGDEVITTPYTYTATASVIHHVGAKIVFADTKFNSYEMDYDILSGLINEKTKAVIPVDIAGKMCSYDEIYNVVASKKNLFKPNNEIQKLFGRVSVIADSAHGFGADYKGKKSGAVADFTCFSFHAVKNLISAEGGAAVWRNDLEIDNEQLYRQFMLYSLNGQSKDAFAKFNKGTWEYDIMFLGYKYNMTDVLSSIAVIQLKRYELLLKRRREIIYMYDEALLSHGIQSIKHFEINSNSSGHLYLARIPGIDETRRNEIIALMAEDGIACNVHYKPLPMFTAYKNLGFDIKNYPNAYNQYRNEITLPLYTLLSDGDVNYIIKKFIEKIGT